MAEDKTKEIMEKLENGIKETMDGEKYKAFLKLQSTFHTYSFNNAMLIYLQKPDATMVAGYKSWQKLERQVIKGEKGISILAPNSYKYHKLVDKIDPRTDAPVKDPKTGDIEKIKVEMKGLSFRKVSVFDVKQTDGKELPTICNELQGNSVNSKSIISTIKKISDVPIVDENIESGAKGYYSRAGNKIAINKGMSLDQTAKTVIHEYAHSQLHNTETAGLLDRATKEVQAESVAYIVSNHFGVDTSQYSFEYLAAWSKGKELAELKSSFDIIQKTANKTIEGMEKVLSKELELKNTNDKIEKSVDMKEKIVEQYKDDFPAIEYISEKTAKVIDNLNNENRSILTVQDIKSLYKKKGKLLEENYNKDDLVEFKKLNEVVDDLKNAQLNKKQIQAQEKALEKQIGKNIEMVQ